MKLLRRRPRYCMARKSTESKRRVNTPALFESITISNLEYLAVMSCNEFMQSSE